MAKYLAELGEILVSVPFDDENVALTRHLRSLGLGRFVLIDRQGKVREHVTEPIGDTQYSRALTEIREEEELGLLSSGTTNYVLELVVNGEFDRSDWALWYGLPKVSENH